MTFEEAVNLFYSDENIKNQFDYWDIDNIIANAQTFISDVENITEKSED